MTDKLKAIAENLKTEHPQHHRVIKNGLNYALLGKVRPMADTFKFGYLVGQYEVIVSTPAGGWRCTCPQGRAYADPVKGFFMDQHCPHLCKHIVACALVWASDEPAPARPASVLEAFRIMIEAEEVPAPKETIDITKQVKLLRKDIDGRDSLMLRAGHVMSRVLAHWGSEVSGNGSRGVWVLEYDMQTRYNEFVSKVKGE